MMGRTGRTCGLQRYVVGLMAAMAAVGLLGSRWVGRVAAGEVVGESMRANCVWQKLPFASPVGKARVWDVAIVSSDNAWLVGSRPSSATAFEAVIEHWDGRTWKAVASPHSHASRNHVSPLESISASGSSDVWAVGPGGAIHYNGRKWAAVPVPRDTNDDPVSVVARAPGDVWVATEWGLTHWDGRRWRRATAPAFLSDGLGKIWDIAAVDRSETIWAVGSQLAIDNTNRVLAVQWQGLRGRERHAPNPGQPAHLARDYDSNLTSVSAVSSTSIWAGGYINDGFAVYHWTTGTWRVMELPGVQYGWDILARSDHDVWLTYDDGHFVRHWDGHMWRSIPSPAHVTIHAMEAATDGSIWMAGADTDRTPAVYRYRC
jgi:hypothetical protein